MVMTIGIIGTGIMGKGIAQAFAEHEGFDVILCGRSIESSKTAIKTINVKLDKLVAKCKMTEEKRRFAMRHIHCGDWTASYSCDLIIETVPEDFNTKVETLKEIISHKTQGYIATNTSSLPLMDIQKAIHYPIIGMHFFNPVPVMKLVEVIYTDNNHSEEIEKIKQLAVNIGKEPIIVKDNPGFIVNRLLITMINEAVLQYQAGIATCEDIDKAMKLGANFPMGPLELADYVGIDVVLAIMTNIEKQTGDTKYRPAKVLSDMVSKNLLGRKTGEGFYKY